MSASEHLLQDNQWKMTEDYNEWSHDDMLLWFQGLNDDRFYDEYEDAFKQSAIHGKDFENMMNISFVQQIFGMDYDIASQLADVVKHRVNQYSPPIIMEYSSSKSRSLQIPSSSEPIQSSDYPQPQSQILYEDTSNSLPLSLIGAIVPRIKCECCDNIKLDEQNLYQCTEQQCKGTKSAQICCKRCFNICHTIIFKRGHQFDHNNDNIICINYMLNSFRKNSKYEHGERAPLQMKRFQRFNRIQHFFGSLTAALTAGAGETTTYLTYSAEMMASITGMTGEIILSTLGTSLLGGGIGAGLSFGIEVCAIFWRYYHGKIDSKRELIRLVGKSFVGNTVAFGGFMGGFVATTAAFGAIGIMGGPLGVGVGIVIGIIIGLALRWKVNKIYDKVFQSEENNERINLQETALDFFHFGNDVSIIQNEQIFNKKEITRRYHGFALIHHPDMNVDEANGNDDDDEKERINGEWLALCSYYGILMAICDERDNNNNTPGSVVKVNNMNEEYLSLLHD